MWAGLYGQSLMAYIEFSAARSGCNAAVRTWTTPTSPLEAVIDRIVPPIHKRLNIGPNEDLEVEVYLFHRGSH